MTERDAATQLAAVLCMSVDFLDTPRGRRIAMRTFDDAVRVTDSWSQGEGNQGTVDGLLTYLHAQTVIEYYVKWLEAWKS